MIVSLVAILLLASRVFSHIEMLYPPPLKSRNDPQVAEADKDYSMTSPLLPDGSNYPCKGYTSLVSKYSSVATLKAGSSINVQLQGTATHNGGSCQFTVSYDGGKTFAVIASVIGGCPIGLSYTVPIPSNLPGAKKALFSWNWFNHTGNREMYQNCAIVDIDGPSGTFTGPKPFLANVFGGSTCLTIEGQDPVFPNPGASVKYGGSYSTSSAVSKLSGCNNDGSTVTIGPSGSSDNNDGGDDTTTVDDTTTTTDDDIDDNTSTDVYDNTADEATSTTSTSIANNTNVGSHRSSRFRATAHKTFASNYKTVTDNVLAAQPAVGTGTSNSSGQAYILCTSKYTFSSCAGSNCVPMGSVSAGTACVDGKIILDN